MHTLDYATVVYRLLSISHSLSDQPYVFARRLHTLYFLASYLFPID